MARFIIAVVVALASSLTFADPAADYSGKWSGAVILPGGAELSLDVNISNAAGTYRVTPKGVMRIANPCVGKEYPIQVTTATSSELVFDVKQSSVLTGCPDVTITFKKSGEKSLDGVASNGLGVRLSR